MKKICKKCGYQGSYARWREDGSLTVYCTKHGYTEGVV